MRAGDLFNVIQLACFSSACAFSNSDSSTRIFDTAYGGIEQRVYGYNVFVFDVAVDAVFRSRPVVMLASM